MEDEQFRLLKVGDLIGKNCATNTFASENVHTRWISVGYHKTNTGKRPRDPSGPDRGPSPAPVDNDGKPISTTTLVRKI